MLPATRGSACMGRVGRRLSIHYQLMQWNWLTMGSAAAKSNMRPTDVPGTGKPCWKIRAVRKVTLNLLQMLLARSTAVTEEGAPSERKA